MSIKVPLHGVAHGRAGDKGNRSNISVIPYLPHVYPYLLKQVTEERVVKIFSHRGVIKVKRYELPNLPALNFVIDGALEGGVNSSVNVDTHGKTLSFFLLGEIIVAVPLSCLPEASPYLNTFSNNQFNLPE